MNFLSAFDAGLIKPVGRGVSAVASIGRMPQGFFMTRADGGFRVWAPTGAKQIGCFAFKPNDPAFSQAVIDAWAIEAVSRGLAVVQMGDHLQYWQ